MTLSELITKVKEQNLSKDQLESYRDQMSQLYAEMQLEMAELEKKQARFMAEILPDETISRMEVNWKSTNEGQRLIVLKRYCLATKELLNSLKSRLYSIY